ncbi:MAG: TraR/DksA family transcriptional regulator [Opitutales bacterium]|jgi:RNA polymerase-binding transcription factor DksA
MPKKNDPKKSAKKPAPAAKAKVKPAAKPAPKPVAKAAPAKGKPAAPVKGAKAVAAPVAKGKGAKAAPVAPVKNAKAAPAAPAAKGAKGAKAPKVDHAVQKGLLNKHRDEHHQGDALVVAPRQKLQFYTINDLKAYLEKRNKSKAKLNVWVPDEERKAREKAAAAARSQGNRSNNIATASIADLLGGSNPFRKGEGFVDESKQVPEKFRRYYRLLVDMRDALHKGLAFHSEEALKKSGKDDAGDLSGYSQHLADAGTDTADRDFALSLISNEQEALKEIADAIERMKKGSYGTCEITGKPIPAARLIAVPFTRYSLEGQKELERNRRAHRRRGGNPLGEIGDEVGFGTGGGGGEDEPSDS